jgi:hypothetical protein
VRILHRLYAFTTAHFWLPCPLCGRMFGGHEKGNGHYQTSAYGGMSVCSNCAEEAENLNRLLWSDWSEYGYTEDGIIEEKNA